MPNQILAHFLFYFLVLSCIHFLHILGINPLSNISFANIFSPSEDCLFFIIFLIINLFFIGFQFANIQNNTQCSSRIVPPQCPSPIHPHSPPSSPSTTPSSFPRVRSLPCSVSLSDISHTFLLPSLIFPFTIIYIALLSR